MQADDAGSDISLWEAMGGVTTGLSRDSAVAQFHMMRSEELTLGASVEQISGREFDAAESFATGTLRELVLQRGMSEVAAALSAGSVRLNQGAPSLEATATSASGVSPVPLDVRMGQRVVEVAHQPSGVTIRTDNGTEHSADYAIVTVPLGVLKNGDISFSPALDADVAQAVENVGFGNLVKVVLRFSSAWWASAQTQQFFGLAPGESDRGMFNYFVNGHQILGAYVLVTFATGDAASTAEAMTDAEVWTEIRAKLVRMFGDASVPAAMPEMLRSSWGSDPLARGAFSFPKVGTTAGVWSRMKLLVGLNVLLAGEHTAPEHFGTVAGAVISGQRAARTLMDEAGVFKPPVAEPSSAAPTRGRMPWGLATAVMLLAAGASRLAP